MGNFIITTFICDYIMEMGYLLQQTVLDGPTPVSVPAKENNNNLTIVDLVPGLNYEIKVHLNVNSTGSF